MRGFAPDDALTAGVTAHGCITGTCWCIRACLGALACLALHSDVAPRAPLRERENAALTLACTSPIHAGANARAEYLFRRAARFVRAKAQRLAQLEREAADGSAIARSTLTSGVLQDDGRRDICASAAT